MENEKKEVIAKMNMNYRKNLKFLTLLLTAVLIASVSAEIYRYMYIDGSITIGSAKMIWLTGSDAPADATISGSTAIVDFHVEQGTPLNFTETLFLKNANSTGSYNYTISMNTAVLSADFQRAKMHIFENYTASPSWTYLHTLDLTNGADTYSGWLTAGNYLRMTFEINATASTGTKPFDITVQYWAP